MSFNYGHEKKKFEDEWKVLRKKYADAGMSEKDIDELYQYDLNDFRHRRNEIIHTQPFSCADESQNDSDGMSPLLAKFMAEFSVQDSYHSQTNPRFYWLDEIEDYNLYEKLNSLSQDDLELITKLSFDGFSQKEIASIYGVSNANISKKIKRIRKFLSEG